MKKLLCLALMILALASVLVGCNSNVTTAGRPQTSARTQMPSSNSRSNVSTSRDGTVNGKRTESLPEKGMDAEQLPDQRLIRLFFNFDQEHGEIARNPIAPQGMKGSRGKMGLMGPMIKGKGAEQLFAQGGAAAVHFQKAKAHFFPVRRLGKGGMEGSGGKGKGRKKSHSLGEVTIRANDNLTDG